MVAVSKKIERKGIKLGERRRMEKGKVGRVKEQKYITRDHFTTRPLVSLNLPS